LPVRDGKQMCLIDVQRSIWQHIAQAMLYAQTCCAFTPTRSCQYQHMRDSAAAGPLALACSAGHGCTSATASLTMYRGVLATPHPATPLDMLLLTLCMLNLNQIPSAMLTFVSLSMLADARSRSRATSRSRRASNSSWA
jgi:hypothetical protein